MKYLLVFAVLLVAFWIWRNKRRPIEPPKRPPSLGTPTPMVACRHCGTHLPQNEAVEGPAGFFCNPEHRRLHGR